MNFEKLYRSLRVLTYPRVANHERMPDSQIISATFILATVCLILNLMAINY